MGNQASSSQSLYEIGEDIGNHSYTTSGGQKRIKCVSGFQRNRRDVFKMCKGRSRLKLNELCTSDDNVRGTRGYSGKLVKFRYTLDCCKYFFKIE